MALPNFGVPLSLQDIQGEFGGTNPISLSEYYGSGGAPGSGTLSIQDFYGLSNSFILTYLVVGGGGAGGLSSGGPLNPQIGGGGAGGQVVAGTLDVSGSVNYTITVGSGGATTSGGESRIVYGANIIRAKGGGYGASNLPATSGGGGSFGGSELGATRTEGGNGADADLLSSFSGGGGGSTGNAAGKNGGVGTSDSITGTSLFYGGGGGGGDFGGLGGIGGSGVGGRGGGSSFPDTIAGGPGAGEQGTDYRGGGGGGSSYGPSDNENYPGGRGGHGVVIIRVPSASVPLSISGNPVISPDGSDTIYEFRNSGSINF